MSEITIGKLVLEEKGVKKDAVHVALAVVTAGESLEPGQHVGIKPDGKAGTVDELIGIVDPFLKQQVSVGERFWLFMYPKTVTNLRHEWNHPAFNKRKKVNKLREAKEFLTEFARDCDRSYIDIKRMARQYLSYGMISVVTKAPENYLGKMPEFWMHYSTITNRILSDNVLNMPFFRVAQIPVLSNLVATNTQSQEPVASTTSREPDNSPIIQETVQELDEDDGCSGC